MDYRNQILNEVSETLLAIDISQVESVVKRICHSRRVFCNGLGRSALPMRGFAMRLMQLGFSGFMVGETTVPAFEKNDLLLVCTASGTNPVLLYHTRQAKKYGGTVAVITGNTISSMARLADDIILIPASNKDSSHADVTSIQPLGSLFEQTAQLLCDTITLQLIEQCHIFAEDMRKRHANIE